MLNVTKQAISCFRDFNKPVGGLLINMSSMFGIDTPPAAGLYGATYVMSALSPETVTQFLELIIQQVWWVAFYRMPPIY